MGDNTGHGQMSKKNRKYSVRRDACLEIDANCIKLQWGSSIRREMLLLELIIRKQKHL
jgi:hypothetical protein